MHRAITFLATVCAVIVAAVAAVAAPAQAQTTRTITCESYYGRLRECRIPDGSQVRIVVRLGAAECRANSTWGVRRGSIWVDRGCRARFAVVVGYTGRVGGGYRGSSPDHRGRYEDQRGGYGHGVVHGGYPHRGSRERAQRGELGRAQNACIRRVQAARLRVSHFGDWSRQRGGVLRVDMWVHGRGGERRVRCEYDPHRGGATLYWLR